MKSQHTYVVLIDLPEALPFELKLQDSIRNVDKIDIQAQKSESELFVFIKELEKNLNEELVFIGEDVIAEKFYRRFLFQKSGFLEIMYQNPVAIIAHFIDEKRAQNFAQGLKTTIDNVVKENKTKNILKTLVEINTEQQDILTYQKWSKLAKIRGLIE